MDADNDHATGEIGVVKTITERLLRNDDGIYSVLTVFDSEDDKLAVARLLLFLSFCWSSGAHRYVA